MAVPLTHKCPHINKRKRGGSIKTQMSTYQLKKKQKTIFKE